MRNLIAALGGNSCAQLTMNSSASSSRSFSMNGEGSIELKSWFVSRSFRLMVCGCARSVEVALENEERIGNSLLSRASHIKCACPLLKIASVGNSVRTDLVQIKIGPP